MPLSKPEWLKVKFIRNENFEAVSQVLNKLSLHTVCEEASCPNRMECFSNKTATFMILGSQCTRNCTFCNVEKGKTQAVDEGEPVHVAEAVKVMGLGHVVITSVTRDDLPDGGALQFAKTITSIKELNPEVVVEVLIPDFKGDLEALLIVVKARPEIINHNIETVPRLYKAVRPMASFERSLKLLERIKQTDKSIYSKSGIMLGLGEKRGEVIEVMKRLREVSCDFLTIGQYLAPSKQHHPVVEYIHPDVFDEYKQTGLDMGFKHVASAPLVRSSYLADEALKQL